MTATEPAGTVYPETTWPPLDPDVAADRATLNGWLADARAGYADAAGRRAQSALVRKRDNERILRLLFLVRCATADAKALRGLWEEARDKLEAAAPIEKETPRG